MCVYMYVYMYECLRCVFRVCQGHFAGVARVTNRNISNQRGNLANIPESNEGVIIFRLIVLMVAHTP